MANNPDDYVFSPQNKILDANGEPLYKDIAVTYLPGHINQPNPYFPNVGSNEQGVLIMQPVVQGVPVTSADGIRQSNPPSLATRRFLWTYPRRVQNFICLNVCYIIIQVLSLNATISDFNEYEDVCPNFAKANLGFSILGVLWIVLSIGGVASAFKKFLKGLQIYIYGLYVILVLTIAVAAFGLLAKDDICEADPPKTITLIGTALFTVFILGLFAFTATKLKRMLIMAPSGLGQRRPPTQAPRRPQQPHMQLPQRSEAVRI